MEFEVPSRSMARTEICRHASVCITKRRATEIQLPQLSQRLRLSPVLSPVHQYAVSKASVINAFPGMQKPDKLARS